MTSSDFEEWVNGDEDNKKLVVESQRSAMLAGHSKWYRKGHVLMLGGWGIVVVVESMGQLTGEIAIGVCMTLLSFACYVLANTHRIRLIVVSLIMSFAFCFMGSWFALDNQSRPEIWIYLCISFMHLMATYDLTIGCRPITDYSNVRIRVEGWDE